MTRYILLQICGNNLKKQNEYNDLIGKSFEMNNHLTLNKDIELHFKDRKIKGKLETIIKENDTKKIFFLSTNKFSCQIQVEKYYNKEQINN